MENSVPWLQKNVMLSEYCKWIIANALGAIQIKSDTIVALFWPPPVIFWQCLIVKSSNIFLTSVVNLINILRAASAWADLESAKEIVKLSVFFTLLGSARIQATCKRLMKLPSGCFLDRWENGLSDRISRGFVKTTYHQVRLCQRRLNCSFLQRLKNSYIFKVKRLCVLFLEKLSLMNINNATYFYAKFIK